LSDTRLWPQSPEAADRLLDFFLLEKAFYEIEYELAHRPDWLRVPLAGTWRIFSARLDMGGVARSCGVTDAIARFTFRWSQGKGRRSRRSSGTGRSLARKSTHRTSFRNSWHPDLRPKFQSGVGALASLVRCQPR